MSGYSRSVSSHASSYFFSAQCAAALSMIPDMAPRICVHTGTLAWNIENAISCLPPGLPWNGQATVRDPAGRRHPVDLDQCREASARRTVAAMNYVFQFGDVLAADGICSGAPGSPSSSRRPRWCSACWSPSSAPWARLGPKPVRWLVNAYIEADPQHAVPGAALLHLLRACRRSASALVANDGGAARRWWSTSAPTRPRSSAPASSRIAKGQIEAGLALGLQAAADLPLRRAEAGAEGDLSRADQPVHPADAELERRLGDLGRRPDLGRRQRPAVAAPSAASRSTSS